MKAPEKISSISALRQFLGLKKHPKRKIVQVANGFGHRLIKSRNALNEPSRNA